MPLALDGAHVLHYWHREGGGEGGEAARMGSGEPPAPGAPPPLADPAFAEAIEAIPARHHAFAFHAEVSGSR
jgi:hypothetical protein